MNTDGVASGVAPPVESASVDAGVSMKVTLRFSVTRTVLFVYVWYALLFKLYP